ncbi:unnamed protein product, partial [Brassica oleracea]
SSTVYHQLFFHVKLVMRVNLCVKLGDSKCQYICLTHRSPSTCLCINEHMSYDSSPTSR